MNRMPYHRQKLLILILALHACGGPPSGVPFYGDSGTVGGDGSGLAYWIPPTPPTPPLPPEPVALRSWLCPVGFTATAHTRLLDETGAPFSWCTPLPLPRLRAGAYITPLAPGELDGDRPICDPEIDGRYPVFGYSDCEPLGSACAAGTWADVPASVTGARIYVDPLAAGGDGSTTTPFGLISDALAVANAGDILLLAAGTYAETLVITTDVTLWGKCVRQTVIAPTGVYEVDNAAITLRASVTVRDLRISGAYRGVRVDRPNIAVTLAGIWIHQATGRGVYALGGTTTLDGVLIDSTLSDDLNSDGRGLVALDGATLVADRVTIENNRTQSVVFQDPGTEITLTDIVVRHTLPEEQSTQWGIGLWAGYGPHVVINRGLFANNRFAGVGAGEAGSLMELDWVTITDTQVNASDQSAGIGLQTQSAAVVTLDHGLIARNHSRGAQSIENAARLELTDVVILATQPAQDELGFGLVVDRAARATALRVLVENSYEAGIDVSGVGSSAYLEDIVVRETHSSLADGRGGRGMNVQQGAWVIVERGLFERNREIGVWVVSNPGVAGSRGDFRDLVIRSTLPLVGMQTYGIGLWVADPSQVTVERSVISGSNNTGVLVRGAGTNLTMQDIVVEKTRASAASFRFGRGMDVSMGAHVAVTRGLFDQNRDTGIIAYDNGTNLTLDDVTIRDTYASEIDLDLGRGMQIHDTASATLTRCLIDDNRDGGIFAFGIDTSLTLTDVSIRNTQHRECSALAPSQALHCEIVATTGLGIYIGASATVLRVEIRNSAALGIQLSRDAFLGGSKLAMIGNPIGANIQYNPVAYDFYREVAEPWMEDNELNFDTTALSIPNPGELWVDPN